MQVCREEAGSVLNLRLEPADISRAELVEDRVGP